MWSLRTSYCLLANYPIRPLNIKLKECLSTSVENHYDIIIAGGGMIGTTLACTLGKNKKLSKNRILLLEGGKEFKYTTTDKYSNRVVALNPNTRTLLNKIGAWKHIENVRYGPIRKLQVWDALSDSMIEFKETDVNDEVAFVVENNLLLHAVTKEVKLLPNINIINDAKVKKCHLAMAVDGLVKVELENGDGFTCDLLLGCDGANSKVREAMGVQYVSWNYNQMGLVATLQLAESNEENVVAWQRFLPTGPVALLPLNSKQSSLVWSNTPENVKRLLQLPNDQFIDELNSALFRTFQRNNLVQEANKILDGIFKILSLPPNCMRQLPPSICDLVEGSRAAFPLGFGHAVNYVSKNVALVGDAAHRVHPLGGQGVNLGFGDVESLNEIISEAVYSGRKLGSLLDLKEYETKRQRHNVPTMLALDGLHKLYSTEATPAVLLRSLGLQITHALSPVKRAIIQQAAH